MSGDPQPALPREVAPGIYWLGDCLEMPYLGRVLHNYQSVYVVAGDDCSLLVESGLPMHVPLIGSQLQTLLAQGLPPLRYLYVSHVETAHAGGSLLLLEEFPELTLCGDVTDLHLYAPGYADRVEQLAFGEELNLGGTAFKLVPAVIRDHINTRWAFDTARRVLFTADGLAYTHYHDPDHCGELAEEATDLDIPAMAQLFSETALYWTRFVDVEPYVAELDRLVDELDVQLIAPTHGLPITDLPATLPHLRRGLRTAATMSGETSLAG